MNNTEKKHYSVFLFISVFFLSGSCKIKEATQIGGHHAYPDVQVAGAMRNVMWKGELGGVIRIDTLLPSKDLYGLGPESYLTGELMIYDGVTFVSRARKDSAMIVEQNNAVSAPFFVYTRVTEWQSAPLPKKIRTPSELEIYLDQLSKDRKRPFAFRLEGKVRSALIHVQNLPPGSTVSSPDEAHRGQVKYPLGTTNVRILGFFSTDHKGVFTHHDSWLHMHLLSTDQKWMGHVDDVIFEDLTLYLPLK